jgi:hypothetical protein
MCSILRLGSIATLFGALACADSYAGKLLDASCVDVPEAVSCDPTPQTVTFAVNVSGKIYRFDDAGNGKAYQAMKSREEQRAQDPASAPPSATSAVTVKVSGSLEGEYVKVETVQVQ